MTLQEVRLCIERLERLAKHLDELQADLSKKYAAETAARLSLHSELVRLRERNAQLEQLINDNGIGT
jgi:hypothetical protein